MSRIGLLLALAILPALSTALAQNNPVITLVANAEGENPVIAPNTWVEVKGSNLSKAGDTRIWQSSDFINSQMPTNLDGVSVTVNGKSAFVYYISPTQINILTPPDAMPAAVLVQVTRNALVSANFSVQTKAESPSFFDFNGGPYVVAQHAADYTFVGPANLIAGLTTTPAKPGETVVLYVNGCGPTNVPVVSGSMFQSGALTPVPTVTIGGLSANVTYADLISPGLFQFNVVIPPNAVSGDNALVTVCNATPVGPVGLITVQAAAALPTTTTLYVSPRGNDLWSGRLADPNATNTDGPFATLDHARAFVETLNQPAFSQITVQLRGGTYYLPSTVNFTAADSGSPALKITYQNYSTETPIIDGGVRLQNWTNTSGNVWKTTLPANTQYFENLFYNGTRRLRPRLGGTPLGAYYRIANSVWLNSAPPPAAAPNGACTVWQPGSGWLCYDRFQYAAGDPISGAWKNLAAAAQNPCGQTAGNAAIAGDIEVIDWEQFSTSKLRISCIDTKNQIVYLTGATGINPTKPAEGGFVPGNRYMVENVQDALTQPGTWFLDHSTTPWTLTYLANPGENPNTDLVVAPQISQVLVASGLQYVTFRGLTFQHDNYVVEPQGHVSVELEPGIGSAVSFQNSQYITFDSGVVTQTSGSGIEFIPCLNSSSPAYCAATNINATVTNNTVQNSAFYDIGAIGIRIGNPYQNADNDSNVPQQTLVQNNVVEGYGRNIPASFGIGQGMGHDNLYTHNDVYDGYHCAISTSQSIAETTVPAGIGNGNNVISFNHVWNLLQGIMNDGGSIRIDDGNFVFAAAGNKILNNKIHDVTDASIMDSNGYGGNGIYLDDSTGLVDVENNLVYRVSGETVYSPHGPNLPNNANIIKNNILAFGQQAMLSVTSPYQDGVPSTPVQEFVFSNNIFYFDRNNNSTPKFFVQGGCIYAGGFAYTSYQLFTSNLYWRTDGAFATDPKAFSVQPNPVNGTNPAAPCSNNQNDYTFYTFAQWQQQVKEDLQSLVQNPGFANPAYPNDDYSLPKGSPIPGFVIFDPTQAGRNNPILKPPAIAATFPTKTFNPATDY
jgi:uncharacterized protein (TIGR03437 family)